MQHLSDLQGIVFDRVVMGEAFRTGNHRRRLSCKRGPVNIGGSQHDIRKDVLAAIDSSLPHQAVYGVQQNAISKAVSDHVDFRPVAVCRLAMDQTVQEFD